MTATPKRRGMLTLAVTSLSALVLLLILLVAYAVYGFGRATAWVRHSEEVRVTLARLEMTLVGVESSQRSYLIARDPAYLDALRQQEEELPSQLRRLRTLVSDNVSQTKRMEELERLAASRIEIIEEVIRTDRDQGTEAGTQLIRSGKGKPIMEQIVALLRRMDDEEARLLSERTKRAARNETLLAVALLSLLIFGTTGVAATLVSGRREIDAQRENEHRQSELILALEQTNGALVRSNKDLDQFAYVASHDLKAPLRGIANVSQWVEEDIGSSATPEIRKQLDLLRGRVRRMEALIDGILSYSRAGRVPTKPEAVDVGQLLAEVVEMASPPSGIAVNVAPPMPVVVTERVLLQQVFLNLVGNAIKHASRPDARIDVSYRDGGEQLEFSVADNGQGIDPQYHDRIWGIFQTLEKRDDVEGAGIGLSVVKKIVEQRGGRAWVESAEGKGAKFSFCWPKAPKGES